MKKLYLILLIISFNTFAERICTTPKIQPLTNSLSAVNNYYCANIKFSDKGIKITKPLTAIHFVNGEPIGTWYGISPKWYHFEKKKICKSYGSLYSISLKYKKNSIILGYAPSTTGGAVSSFNEIRETESPGFHEQVIRSLSCIYN